ncbi:WD40-repeat-containing domain protein [Globomyces pollinis-pini]|nr:WD40-repeat-containing domain protein [Globomyces pollinis-pini]
MKQKSSADSDDPYSSLSRTISSDRLSLFGHSPISSHLNSLSSDHVKLNTGGSLTALCLSPNLDRIVVAGRDILKIFSTGPNPQELLNLRAGVKISKVSSTNDVKWGGHQSQNLIVSATSTGAIVIYDIEKSTYEKQDRVLSDHKRAVNRISIHPAEQSLLLTASQDGTMRIWDLRSKGRAKFVLDGKAESVRDCQFNPALNWSLAAVFDNGCLQTWDIRSPKQFERKWSAHNGLALTVDWDHHGKLIATGGRDKVIKIWNYESESKRSIHNIQSIAPVSRVKWRPGYDTQIATSSLTMDNRVMVWDFTHPYLAQYCFEEHDDVATGLQWQDSNSIWTCSKDQNFGLFNLSQAYRPLELINYHAIGTNNFGTIVFANVETKEQPPIDTLSTSHSHSSNLNLDAELVEPMPSVVTGPQFLGQIQTLSFDYNRFAVLAELYSFDCSSIYDTCENNYKVAMELDLSDIAHVWKMIQLTYGQDPLSPINLNKSHLEYQETLVEGAAQKTYHFLKGDEQIPNIEDTGPHLLMDPVPGPSTEFYIPESSSEDSDSEFFVPTNYKKPETDLETMNDPMHRVLSVSQTTPTDLSINTAFKKLSTTFEDKSVDMSQSVKSVFEDQYFKKDIPPKQFIEAPTDVKVSPWTATNLANELLEHFSDQVDVQMNVYIIMTLRNVVSFADTLVEYYTREYIDLLQRFQLWQAATKIINHSSIASIRSLNEESTTIHTSCFQCGTAVPVTLRTSFRCEKCDACVSWCVVCHKVVKGVYVWCQFCSHGGHMECLDGWFCGETMCPTGCGHECTF